MPAFIVELKCDHSAEEAVEQIRKKNYIDYLRDYSGEILIVDVNYDKKVRNILARLKGQKNKTVM